MKILWMSRRQPLPAQLDWLEAQFDDEVELLVDDAPFSGATDIANRFESSESDELVIICPLLVLQQVTDRGIRPLVPDMIFVHSKRDGEECNDYDPESDVILTGKSFKSGKKSATRHFRFDRFKRVIAVEVKEAAV